MLVEIWDDSFFVKNFPSLSLKEEHSIFIDSIKLNLKDTWQLRTLF